MLLIGSRAVKYHHPFFRKPKDYDFIATKQEVDDFLSKHKWEDISHHDKKVRARVQLSVPTVFEFELTSGYPSSLQLSHEGTHYQDQKLNLLYKVASPEILFLLKKSHICFNIHWKKNIGDYLFLKDNHKPSLFNINLFNLRFEETKARVKFKERNFDVDNSEFFKVSEKLISRMIPHDNLHFATCFYDRPLFMAVKDDLSKAAMNERKVRSLSYEDQIKLIQEEAMALSLERNILPCVRDKKEFNPHQSYVDTCGRMVYNYLPMFMKFFAADNFLQILDLKINYVEKFFNNVQGLNLPDENIQFAKQFI